MGLKKFNAKKEIKKLKRRNSKLKKIGIIGILIGTIFIISSYALYSYTGSSLAFDSKVSKRIKTEIEVINGEAEEKIKEGDYKEEQTFKIKPTKENYEYEEVTCDNEVTTSYDKTSNTLKISNQTKDTKCQVKLVEVKYIFNQRYVVIEEEPDFSKGEPPLSGKNTGSGLYKTEDDDGDSYYFRGDIKNNYVKLGTYKEDIKFYVVKNQLKAIYSNKSGALNYCNEEYKKGTYKTLEECQNSIEEKIIKAGDPIIWRIVRINGDGSIRLINDGSIGQERYNSSNEVEYAGYTRNNTHPCTKENPCTKEEGTASTMKTYLEEWYEKNLSDIDDKIETSRYCNDVSFGEYIDENKTNFHFDTYMRLVNDHQPTLKCSNPTEEDGSLKLYGGSYKLKIGLISIDELYYGGYSNYAINYENNYLYNNYIWLTMSACDKLTVVYIYEADISHAGSIPATDVSYYHYAAGHVRPVINLKANVQVTGEGTKGNPFVIN